MITIDKRVKKRGRAPLTYPWDRMEVGDSFESRVPASQLLSAAKSFAKHHHPAWRFSTEKQASGKIRIWRVE